MQPLLVNRARLESRRKKRLCPGKVRTWREAAESGIASGALNARVPREVIAAGKGYGNSRASCTARDNPLTENAALLTLQKPG